ncbi:MAG: NrfD/PsrC family molybdoenzyme membrane anchor subunit [Actinomycetota bacterium]
MNALVNDGQGQRERLRERVEAPLRKGAGGWGSRLLTAGLVLVVAWGVFAWTVQLRRGLAVTSLSDRVSWGLYITNFVFFIGISYAGTLVSGVLRLTKAEWRRPVTRLAELITVVGLLIGGAMVVVDLGRPERALNLLLHPQLRSPIMWDVLSIGTYLVGAVIYLWLPLVPDLALLRDSAGIERARRRLYGWCSLRWVGASAQRSALNRSIAILAVVLIPVAISAHSVVSWIFGMTTRPGWDSSIFAPYFVVGAVYSGTAVIVLVAAIYRSRLRLQEFITEAHFRHLASLMLVLGLTYAYLTFSDYLTAAYKLQQDNVGLLTALFTGRYALLFWISVGVSTVIPVLLLCFRRTRTMPGILTAAGLVMVGMWLKRVVIVVPTMAQPLMPHAWGVYWPSWVEWSITAAAFAAFALLLVLAVRILPIVSVWELEEGWTDPGIGRSTRALDPVMLADRATLQ